MTHRILICTISLLTFAWLVPVLALSQEEKPAWDDLSVLQINRERPRATVVKFPDDRRGGEAGARTQRARPGTAR